MIVDLTSPVRHNAPRTRRKENEDDDCKEKWTIM
jgi:hypothetical protein